MNLRGFTINKNRASCGGGIPSTLGADSFRAFQGQDYMEWKLLK